LKLSKDKKIMVIFMIILIPSIYPIILYFNDKSRLIDGQQPLSLYSEYEYQMGLWIQECTPKNSIILSDPETIYLLSGFSGRKAIIPNTMLIQDLQIEDLMCLEIIRELIFNSKDSEVAANYSQLLGKNNHVLITYSGRTEKWLENPSSYQYITRSYPLDESELFNHLNNQTYFHFLKQYGPNQIFLYELNTENIKETSRNFEIGLINNIIEYDNLSTYETDISNSNDKWYLNKIIFPQATKTLTLYQYISILGTASVVRWNITIPSYFKKVSLFVLNLNILNSDPNSTWAYRKNSETWNTGNFTDPLQKILKFEDLTENTIQWYGKSTGMLTKLGLFIILGEF
jgi:hypothetical protein